MAGIDRIRNIIKKQTQQTQQTQQRLTDEQIKQAGLKSYAEEMERQAKSPSVQTKNLLKTYYNQHNFH